MSTQPPPSAADGQVLGRLAAVLAATAGAWLATRWPAEMRSVAMRDLALPLVAACWALAALVPLRALRGAQELLLVALYVGQRAIGQQLGAGLGPWWDLPLGVVISLLPWSRPGWRTAGIRVAALAFLSFPFLSPRVGYVLVHPAVQLLFCAALTDGLGPRDALRYTLARMVAPRMSVLPGDVLRVERSQRGAWLGAAWVVLGLLLARIPVWDWIDPVDPWSELRALRPDRAVGASLIGWALLAAHTFARMLIAGGTLRLLGMPISAPIDAPWRSSDLLDYWRRVHTWRSVVFRAAFLRHLGWTGPWGVAAVFLLSGLQHTAGDPRPWPGVALWGIIGLLAAGNHVLNRWRARRRVAAWMGGQRPQPPGTAVALLTGLAILALHGFLQLTISDLTDAPD